MTSMIRRILVADRGEAARRIFATCHAIGIETIAAFREPDAMAPYVVDADSAVRLSEASPSAAILTAVGRCCADAVHPGYSDLADDPELAHAVAEAGLTWVGAPRGTLAVTGSKLETRTVLASAGLPVLPCHVERWSQGRRSSPPVPRQAALPILVKPALGRDGFAIRVVRDAGRLAEAVEATGREALSRFGDPTVLCERYIERARRIEVQVVADTAGTVVPLGERECSIQRHRRPIVEEAPSAGVDPGLRAELFAAARSAAHATGLVGLATVEFVLAPSGEFYVLQLSPRLPAGHPVTECVFGVDLVRLQLLVAEGGALPFAAPPPMRGHAIGVRLTAEDPAYDWRPSIGPLRRFEVPGVAHRFGPLLVPGLRLDPAFESSAGAVMTAGLFRDDPLLGTVVAWSPSRLEAARMLANALTRTLVHGVNSNRDLLVRVLRSPAFLTGTLETEFLDRHPDVYVPLLSSLDAVRLCCLAAALAGAARRRAAVPALASLPIGWRNVPSTPQVVAYDGPTGSLEVAYGFDRYGELATWSVCGVDPERAGAPWLAARGSMPGRDEATQPEVRVLTATPDRVDLEIEGARQVFHVHQIDGDPVMCYVDSPEGSVALRELPRFPPRPTEQPRGSLFAPLPGTVGHVLAIPGQRVVAGDLLFTVESTAVAHPVHAPASGVVTDLWVTAGSRVEAGALLAVLAPDAERGSGGR